MQTTTKGQRRRASRKANDARVVRIELMDGMDRPRWITADLLDITEGGVGARTLMVRLSTSAAAAAFASAPNACPDSGASMLLILIVRVAPAHCAWMVSPSLTPVTVQVSPRSSATAARSKLP